MYKVEHNVNIRYIKEIIMVEKKAVGTVYATNIYHETADGWGMLAHHASPAFPDAETKINLSLH